MRYQIADKYPVNATSSIIFRYHLSQLNGCILNILVRFKLLADIGQVTQEDQHVPWVRSLNDDLQISARSVRFDNEERR